MTSFMSQLRLVISSVCRTGSSFAGDRPYTSQFRANRRLLHRESAFLRAIGLVDWGRASKVNSRYAIHIDLCTNRRRPETQSRNRNGPANLGFRSEYLPRMWMGVRICRLSQRSPADRNSCPANEHYLEASNKRAPE